MSEITTDGPVDVIVVHVEDLRFGFLLDAVIEVLPLVATSPLPRSPDVIEGLADVRGTLVPVLSLRARLRLTPRAADPDDHVVLCEVAGRAVGIRVDGADEVAAVDPRSVAAATDVAAVDLLHGVTRLHDGLVLVYDVRSFLAADEALRLDEALAAAAAVAHR